MAVIHLVRHGRPILSDRPRWEWPLDPAYLENVDRLAGSGVLPLVARWFSSPERRAVETARRLGHPQASIVNDFREQERPDGLIDDLPAVVERSLLDSDAPPLPGWEPVRSVTDRVTGALESIDSGDGQLVLVGPPDRLMSQ